MTHTIEGLKSAADTTKQIITLSTAIVGLTATFAKEFKVGPGVPSVPTTLACSWVFLIVAVLAGIATLMAITGSLSKIDQGVEEWNGRSLYDANSINIRVPAIPMIIFFILGLVFTVFAGSSRLGSQVSGNFEGILY
jgi:hypothetical protein